MTVLRAAVAAWAMALLLIAVPSHALEIPPFTPNVVDPGGVLDEDARATVNAELQRIRAEAGILGAVFIVDTLGGEPIEAVAVEAFRQWELGRKGDDNGLLLVLAMRDRQSRLEVGYGLEGRIPHLVAKRALDAHLAPGLRAGDTPGAIVATFGFLARVAANDPEAAREIAETNAADAAAEDGEPFFWRRGLLAWGVLAAAVWLTLPLRDAWVRRRRARLEQLDPALLRDDGEIAGNSRRTSRGSTSGVGRIGRIGIAAFLTLNPGIFVFIGSALAEEAFVASLVLTPLAAALVIAFGIRRYASPERYRAFLARRDKQRAALIAKGHLREASPGVFAYTEAYHASVAASSSSSSSSSGFGSSSSSSSSGGGRSGGGGASGSW